MDASPGYPHPNPCLSFWLQGVRNSPLLGHRTTAALPEAADVTIIGSGLSGAAIAYFLLTGPNPPARVTLLEAREACDGATARNGGHCRPDCYRGSRSDASRQLKIIQNEMDTLNLVEEIIAKEGIECDFWRGLSYDVPMDQTVADYLAASFKEFRIVEQILDPTEAKRATRCPAATAAYRFPAGSLYPYKLVAHLLTLCIEKHGLNLQTHTPVRSVVPGTGAAGGWTVQTDRGAAYGDYLIQRPADGVIIFGGARRSMPVEKLLGNTDDSARYPEMTKALRDALPRYFEGWDAGGDGGIMGYTSEGIPYVGALHDKPGAFVCAGHHGHGMARIMTCAKGLAAIIQGASWASTGLPECFQPTRERLAAPAQAVVHNIGKQDVIGQAETPA
ncbi:FAD dependent oxidoreductase [Mycena latifolia]|nr:FAD dependent oxidoreductase [Mycena latifolia]